MEESRRFSQTQVTTGRSTQSSTGDTEQFDIIAVYIPEPLTGAAVPVPRADLKSLPKPGIKSTDMKSTDMKSKTAVKPKMPKMMTAPKEVKP